MIIKLNKNIAGKIRNIYELKMIESEWEESNYIYNNNRFISLILKNYTGNEVKDWGQGECCRF
jgi:hypothetical protein